MSFIADEFGVAQPDQGSGGRPEKCQDCHFFNASDGTCHIMPPVVGVIRWPKVGADDWCGEFMSDQSLIPVNAGP